MQPTGSSLFDHTSDASESELPSGYVFAYENPNEIFGDWSPFEIGWKRTASKFEVITFEARSAFNPGDWEGVAVIPVREICRENMREWLMRQADTADDENIRSEARKAIAAEPHLRLVIGEAKAPRLSTRDPATMTQGQINAELEKLSGIRSKLGQQMIDDGRGHERPTDMVGKTDPLSLAIFAVSDRQGDLQSEIRTRAGPGNYKMPAGRMFGPRK